MPVSGYVKAFANAIVRKDHISFDRWRISTSSKYFIWKKVPFFSLQLLQSLLGDCHDRQHIWEKISILLSVLPFYLTWLLAVSHWALSFRFKASKRTQSLLWNGTQVHIFLFRVIIVVKLRVTQIWWAQTDKYTKATLNIWAKGLHWGSFRMHKNAGECFACLMMNFSQNNEVWTWQIHRVFAAVIGAMLLFECPLLDSTWHSNKGTSICRMHFAQKTSLKNSEYFLCFIVT